VIYLEDIKSLGTLMSQVMRAKHNRMNQLIEGLELHPAQAPILFTLIAHDGLTQKGLGDMISLKPATITIMLNRMQKAGLIERREDKEDLRLSRVYVTERGKVIAEAAKLAMDQIQQEAYSGFSSEEMMLMRRLLVHIKENLEKASLNNTKKVRH
jgi:DNA-binding MarR family transcriptional regulator